MKNIVVSLLLFSISLPIFSEIIIRPYNGYTLWIDTEKKGPVFYMYHLGPDTGDFKERNYKFDSWIPDEYEQTSNDKYNPIQDKWDMGHVVPLNHLDSRLSTAEDTEYMTNILPQARTMNRNGGTWFETEKISECLRESGDLFIFGGLIWGDNEENDYFIDSHGIETPDYYWKAIIKDDEIIVWKMKNSNDPEVASRSVLDDCITTLREISTEAIIPIFIPESMYDVKAEKSWDIDCEGSWIN